MEISISDMIDHGDPMIDDVMSYQEDLYSPVHTGKRSGYLGAFDDPLNSNWRPSDPAQPLPLTMSESPGDLIERTGSLQLTHGGAMMANWRASDAHLPLSSLSSTSSSSVSIWPSEDGPTTPHGYFDSSYGYPNMVNEAPTASMTVSPGVSFDQPNTSNYQQGLANTKQDKTPSGQLFPAADGQDGSFESHNDVTTNPYANYIRATHPQPSYIKRSDHLRLLQDRDIFDVDLGFGELPDHSFPGPQLHTQAGQLYPQQVKKDGRILRGLNSPNDLENIAFWPGGNQFRPLLQPQIRGRTEAAFVEEQNIDMYGRRLSEPSSVGALMSWDDYIARLRWEEWQQRMLCEQHKFPEQEQYSHGPPQADFRLALASTRPPGEVTRLPDQDAPLLDVPHRTIDGHRGQKDRRRKMGQEASQLQASESKLAPFSCRLVPDLNTFNAHAQPQMEASLFSFTRQQLRIVLT